MRIHILTLAALMGLGACDGGASSGESSSGADAAAAGDAGSTAGGDAQASDDTAAGEPTGGGSDAGGSTSGAGQADTTGQADVTAQADVPAPPVEPKAPMIGDGAASFEVLVGAKWLAKPTGLGFNPMRPDELWIANRGDDSFTVLVGVGTPAEEVVRLYDKTHHFGENMSSLSFGDNDAFGTCQESDNTYNGQAPPNDFMGPALWPADRELFVAEDAVQQLGPHLDMLHSTPWCMGIAWERDNRYWTFNGDRGSIDMMDFKEPHPPGGDDHSDGEKLRLLDGALSRVPGVPGNMIMDAETGWLYVADTGNRRVLAVNTASGTMGAKIYANMDPGTTFFHLDDVESKELVSAHSGALEQPSGLAIAGGVLYVGDYATGLIHAFDMDGAPLATLDTGRGEEAIMGLAVSPDGALLFVDNAAGEIVRVDPE